MNIYKSLFLGLVCSAGMHCTFAQTTVWNPDNQNGTFTNPIMWGDWPDPDLIRLMISFISCLPVCTMCRDALLLYRKTW